MKHSLITLENEGILHLTINRPQEKNALNRQITAALTEQINQASDSTTIKAIVLSGAGSSAFCAGADLRELAALTTTTERRAFFGAIGGLIGAFAHCSKPIITKVQGYALAGGCGLVAASDIAVASDDAIFGLPEIQIGLAPLMIIAPLSRCIGQKALADLVLTGDRISADRALAIGLISRVTTTGDLETTVETIARRVATLSGDALATAKRTLWTASDHEFFSSLDSLADRVGLLASGEDALEGITAFLEKRRPSWRH